MASFMRLWTPIHLLLLAAAYFILFRVSDLTWDVIVGLWFFFPVGIVGAIIANATGTGGGVVFVPVFTALERGGIMVPPELLDIASLSPEESIGVSFLIQCFGMSIGALVWGRAIFLKDGLAWDEKVSPQVLLSLTATPLATGIPALLLTQSLVEVDGKSLIFYFKIFSLLLGLILLLFTWSQRGQPASKRRLHVTAKDHWVLLGLGAVGGAVTALFSVGIGEFLAIYLILKKFPTKVAIAVAVWVSVCCVITGIWSNLWAGTVRIEIALIAVPGAIIGGILAKKIAQLLGSLWLKTLASIWIIASSIYLLLS